MQGGIRIAFVDPKILQGSGFNDLMSKRRARMLHHVDLSMWQCLWFNIPFRSRFQCALDIARSAWQYDRKFRFEKSSESTNAVRRPWRWWLSDGVRHLRTSRPLFWVCWRHTGLNLALINTGRSCKIARRVFHSRSIGTAISCYVRRMYTASKHIVSSTWYHDNRYLWS